ncbi:MAG: metallophosphoesterase [Peptostreptococcaceae bacterium]
MLVSKRIICSFLALGIAATSATSIVPVNALRKLPEPLNAVEKTQANEVVTLIPSNSNWKYEDTDKDMYSQNFFEKSYDNASWKEGKAPLGYPATDYSDLFGPVSSGTLVNSVAKPNAMITYYFTKDFTVSKLEDLSKLEATVGIDDGFVMYINGKEVNRSYMNEGEITHASEANYVNEPSSAEGTVKIDLTSAKDLLVEGNNRIAVSVHNRDANSSDIYFDMELKATYGEIEEEVPEVTDAEKTPKQVNAHMGDDASTQVNLTYTTIAGELETKAVLNKKGSSEKITVTGENTIGNADKYFHKIAVSDLEPNTEYEYTVGTEECTYSGSFKTAPAKGSKEKIKFAFLADTQVSNATNAEAAGATFSQISDDVDFVYLAGDITDKATTESQWEVLFNNDGLFKDAGQELFGSKLIAAVQGNHDNNTLTRHINAPAEAGNIVYSFDYGPATFVMLNLESARYDADARAQQKEYLTQAVNEAKERGQWTFVGFHKSLYTGASHITDSDAIEARKYWGPTFAELDVDVVMQGHDHVYSRGFVTTDGYNANPLVDNNGSVVNPENAPLYMVGGHAGGLKWYSKKNYTVGTGDPLSPGYSFLDVNSTDTGSDVKKEQVIVEMEVEEDELTLNTYMFKYDPATDEITTDKYLYDSLTVTRNETNSEYSVGLGNVNNVEGKKGTEFKMPVTLNAFPTDKEIRSSEVVINVPEGLEVKDVELNKKMIKADNFDWNVNDGKLRIALSNSDDTVIFTNSGSSEKNALNVTFALTEDKDSNDKTQIRMSDFVFRCNNDEDVEYDTSRAISTITYAEKEVAQAFARELYQSEGTEVIPENMKAVAVEFTLIENTTSVKYGETEFLYSPEYSEKNGNVTYVGLVPSSLSLDELSKVDNYTLTQGSTQAETVVFGDIKNDGIDAQDALSAVSAWLRKTDLNDKQMITTNVSADGKINTRDAIDIVDNFVSGKEFKILSK